MDLLGIFILGDPSFSSTLTVNLLFLLTESSHSPAVSSSCRSALQKAARISVAWKKKPLPSSSVCLRCPGQQDYEVSHQGHAVCMNPSVQQENDTIWNVSVGC